MCRPSNFAGLLFLFVSQPLSGVLGKPLCSPVEVTRPLRTGGVSAGAAKPSPGYLVGAIASGKILNSFAHSDVPDGQMCATKGPPVWERAGAALLRECGLLLPASDVHNTTTEGLCIQNKSGAPLAFLLTEAEVRELCLFKKLVLQVSCPQDIDTAITVCYTLSLQDSLGTQQMEKGQLMEGGHRRAFQRHVLSVEEQVSEVSHERAGGVLAVVVGVVGLVLVVLVLAVCAGSGGANRYDTAAHGQDPNPASSHKRSTGDVVAEPSPPADSTESASAVKVLKTNGTSSDQLPKDQAQEPTRDRREATPTKPDAGLSREQSIEQSGGTASVKEQERARTLSARSFDPLPDVPTEGADKVEVGEGAMDDDDDDPYAEVPVDDVGRMEDSESDEADGSAKPSPVKNAPSPFPPYGKVSRHGKVSGESKDQEDETDSYAEVRDVIRHPPTSLGQRGRSHTQPPGTGDLASPRDKRSLTESATHMPLPDIPGAARSRPVLQQETLMYNSIHEDRAKETSPKPKKKERLYESMDEVEEKDLYESVPEGLTKVESPTTLVTPTSAIPRTFSEVAPMPPRSPIPSREQPKGEPQGKKLLEKTLSASHASTEDGKRRFSFFGRKKTASVSSRPKKSEQPESPPAPPPIPATSSPQHKSPLPNIPIPSCPNNEEEEEDNYDRVTPITDQSGMFQLGKDDAKAKAMSLPMAFRTGGGRPNLPLPKVPEDSGSATVKHQRVMEAGPDDYDMVKVADPIPDEPNYDTVRLEGPPLIAVDPPYDKIDKKELQELRERELLSSEDAGVASSGSQDLESYSTVRGEETTGNDQPGLPPDHDEEGYAVVPEEIKMRKRALSASQGMKPGSDSRHKQQGNEKPCDTILESRPHSMAVSSAEAQYATVDMAAKRDRKKQELEEALRMQEELRAYSEEPLRASPVPPPLPPAINPDDMEEMQQPPVPLRSDDMHQLNIEIQEAPQSDSSDPPYARVKSKTDNPYSSVQELESPRVDGSDPPYARVTSQDGGLLVAAQPDGSDPPYARVKSKPDDSAAVEGGELSLPRADGSDPPYARVTNHASQDGELLASPQPDSSDPPYARVKGKTNNPYAEVNRPYAEVDVDWLASVKESAVPQPSSGADVGGEVEEDKPYDTIEDLRAEIELSGGISPPEQELPSLETAESANIYDSLLPETSQDIPLPDHTKNTPRSMV